MKSHPGHGQVRNATMTTLLPAGELTLSNTTLDLRHQNIMLEEMKFFRTWRWTSWRILCIILSGFFTVATFLQANDPDAGVWMAVYAIPAVLSLVCALRPQTHHASAFRCIAVFHLLASCSGICYMAVLMNASQREIEWRRVFKDEEGRELCGLVIVVLWMVAINFVSYHRSNELPTGLLIAASVVSFLPLLLSTILYYVIDTRDIASHCKDLLPYLGIRHGAL